MILRGLLLGLLGLTATGCSIKAPQCGDGVLDERELCDDGNLIGGDGCSASCQNVCGDAVLDVDEVCDDGNGVEGDGCSATCQPEACGDAVLNAGEVCDDGNALGGDGCSADCAKVEACGDGALDAGEACDDGELSDDGPCSADCSNACGDGVPGGGEVCDDGNALSGDGCRADCRGFEACGDGLLDTGEECDDGNAMDGDGCSAACSWDLAATCGNGVLDPGEFCPTAPVATMWADAAQLAIGDLDGDGDDDVVVSSAPGIATGTSATTFESLGGGTLAARASTMGSGGYELALADLDADGGLDLVVAEQTTVGIYLLDGLVLASGSALGYSGMLVTSVAVGQLNGDGTTDFACSARDHIPIGRNNGAGMFALSLYQVPTEAVAIGDVDGDGLDDLVSTTVDSAVSRTVQARIGIPSGLPFAVETLGTATTVTMRTTLQLVDVDSDGDRDVVVGQDGSSLLIEREAGAWLPAMPIGFVAIAFADLDADGDADALSSQAGFVRAHMNDGTGAWPTSWTVKVPLPAVVGDVATGDLNADGFTDLVVTITGESVRVLLSDP